MDNLPTFEDVLEEQKQIDILCSDRTLSTKEIFTGNAFYGNDFIIKSYIGIKHSYALKLIIPHGIILNTSHIWEAEEKSAIPTIACYQKSRYDFYKKKFYKKKRVTHIAAPYTCIPDIIKNIPDINRKGTIFFPAHSTHHVTAVMNYERLAEFIENLDQKYHPITICMYWRDVNLGHDEYFKIKGFRIVSAGHIFDRFFLFRLYYLCSQHKFSMSNSIGSHLFFSQYAGCSSSFMDRENVIYSAEKNILARDVAKIDDVHLNLIKNFSFNGYAGDREKNKIVKDFLGISSIASKYFLILTLIKSELIYFLSKK